MNNLECVVATLVRHREARGWTDDAVATDVLAQLGLDVAGDAAHATPAVDPSLVTEDEVVAAETAAQEAVDKAKAARDALNAQVEAEARTKEREAADQANAATDARKAALAESKGAAEHPDRPAMHADDLGERHPSGVSQERGKRDRR